MAATLDLGKEEFILHMAYPSAKISIYLACKAQIVLLMAKKVIIPIKYLNFADVFLKKSVIKLFKRFDINKHLTNLE